MSNPNGLDTGVYIYIYSNTYSRVSFGFLGLTIEFRGWFRALWNGAGKLEA